MPRIYDNLSDETKLGAGLNEFLHSFNSIDVATGYFDLRGWAELDELVTAKAAERHDGDRAVARVLIGMVLPGDHDTLMRQIAQPLSQDDGGEGARTRATRIRDDLVAHLAKQLSRGIPTAAQRRTLHSLRSLIKDGHVELRVYTRQPLHGKTYILHRDDPSTPRHAFVGSSNFTRAGLTSNLELNVDVSDADSTAKLEQWFTDLWDDRWTLRIDEQLLEIIEDSWATPIPRSPYEVYLKVCYIMSQDIRAGIAQFDLNPLIKNTLLDYQATAVKTLAKRIMHRGGTMLGDVVGLGKTLTAIAVALMLRDEYGFQPLVICPKNLVEMWEEHLKKYDLAGRVVSYSMVHQTLPDLPRYRFVIIDESHTLRNNDTRTYNAVHEYLHDNDSHVLLLTATPYNLRYTDVANQLALFLNEDEDLGIAPVYAFDRNPRLRDNLEFAPTTLAAFKKSEEPEDWKRLMGEHLIRRTRSFVVNTYAHTDEHGNRYLQYNNEDGTPGQRFTFPKRKAIPIDHSFGEDDPAAKMTSERTLETLASLRLPRYDLASYVHPDAKHKASPEDKQVLEDFERSRGQVAGFVRTNFYKRLSSCGHSFRLSLVRHLRRNDLFIYALTHGVPLPAGTLDPAALSDDETDLDALPQDSEDGTEGQLFDAADDYEALQQYDPRGLRWVNPKLFTAELLEALKEDSAAMTQLLSWYGEWSYEKDSKLQALAQVLTTTHSNDKVLIFTEYKDTAKYLANGLAYLGISQVEAATGDTKDPTSLARRFSPKSNVRLNDDDSTPSAQPQDEIRVLVATDVLSEGQNLQDSHVIINFDLPWAIIKLIQRAGRVDRIGQQSDTVYIYSIAHGAVEDVLDLRRRIHERLVTNAQTFGSDEQFFGTEEETKIITELYEGQLSDIDTSEDVDAGSLAYEIWNKATKDDPELAKRIKKLPDLIDATRPQRLTESPGVLCFTASNSGLEGYAWSTPEGAHRLLTGHEALAKFEATPQTPALALRSDHDELVHHLVTGPLTMNFNTSGRLRGERKTIWNRLGGNRYSNPEHNEALDALYNHPLTTLATQRLRRARRRHVSEDDLIDLIADLHASGQLVTSTDRSTESIHIVASMGVN
ncbi:helicase-related protein [Corynebacterium maris]|uniref:helicase-related protein n=1 Tax=Corynebacterium maris TaxID=575200 RepID=UPI0004161F9A|nr:helicase-related protein [Corynebacterium maris]